MNRNMLIPLLCLLPMLIANAQASEVCPNEQRSINVQNSDIMTGHFFYGPIKSVQVTTTMPEDKNDKSYNETRKIEFSRCGRLIAFHASSKNVISKSSHVVSFMESELVSDNPYTVKSLSGFDAPNEANRSTTSITYYLGNNGEIIKLKDHVLTINKYYSDVDKQNEQDKLSTDSEEKSSTAIINWKNGLIDTLTGEQYGAKIYHQYNYNHLNQLERVADTKVNKPKDMFSTNIKYYYDSNGFLDKKITELCEDEKLYSTIDLKCLEKDLHGNCLTSITTNTRSGFKPSVTRNTKYIYKYY